MDVVTPRCGKAQGKKPSTMMKVSFDSSVLPSGLGGGEGGGGGGRGRGKAFQEWEEGAEAAGTAVKSYAMP